MLKDAAIGEAEAAVDTSVEEGVGRVQFRVCVHTGACSLGPVLAPSPPLANTVPTNGLLCLCQIAPL